MIAPSPTTHPLSDCHSSALVTQDGSVDAGQRRDEGRRHDLVRFSGAVLQGMTFQPTGAIVAAPTTSLVGLLPGDDPRVRSTIDSIGPGGVDVAVSVRNDVDLITEEYGDGELPGNFTQAFSHVGLVMAVWAIDQAERAAHEVPDDRVG